MSERKLIKSTQAVLDDPPSNGVLMPWNKDNENVYTKDGCRLCHSKCRQEAESMYDINKNINRIQKFLATERSETISYHAIRNHLLYHYSSRSTAGLIKEFANEIDDWQGIQEDYPAALRRAMGIMEREMVSLAATSEGLSLDERRKSADCINKLASTLLTYRGKLRDMDKEQEPITVVFNQLQLIVQDEIKHTENSEAKGLVLRILERLKQNCSEINID